MSSGTDARHACQRLVAELDRMVVMDPELADAYGGVKVLFVRPMYEDNLRTQIQSDRKYQARAFDSLWDASKQERVEL